MGSKKLKKRVIEKLANNAHTSWSDWMEYLLNHGYQHKDGSVTIPAYCMRRWRKQMATPYKYLTEGEKESDRTEARRILDIIYAEVGKCQDSKLFGG